MKKIGVVTLFNSMNYGGVLQAAALSSTLRKMDLQVVNITCQKMQSSWKNPINYVKDRIRLFGHKGFKTKIRILGGVIKTIILNVNYFSARKKRKKFCDFIEQNLTITPYCKTDLDIKKYCSNYDAYITGSDQVWNNEFNSGKFNEVFFLTFVPEGIPCFSYAASVGGEKSDSYIYEIIQRTRHYNGITVREHSLENHMKRLGCQVVQTVLDPTLLVSKEDWMKLEKKPKMNLPDRYVLVYFLEKKTTNDPIITRVSQELGLPVVDILPKHGKSQYKRISDYTAGPAEFLYYVNHADYVITNSFHMVVFSLLYQKKFISLQRAGQENRIRDLLKLVDMQDHEIDDVEDWKIILKDIPEISPKIMNVYKESIEYIQRIKEQV